MHARRGMTKILICLLMLRVVAAPITLRPTTYRPQAKHGFVVRICSWPTQRMDRSNIAAIVAPGHDEDGHCMTIERLPLSSTCDHALLTDGQLLQHQQLMSSLQDTSSRRLIDSPRC
jgi:hypothetical protein